MTDEPKKGTNRSRKSWKDEPDWKKTLMIQKGVSDKYRNNK
jgi:hypothetical protein